MFTDIVGYTALTAQDEQKALQLLDKQRKLLRPIVEEFSGIINKEIGDGLLITFPIVSEAVKCAIHIQEVTKEIDDLNLRIGIHEGEITERGEDVLGDDVNIASRIEPFSAIGGVAISGKVQQNILSLPEYKTKLIGIPKLKGVEQEVKVYCIISHGLPETEISTVSAKLEKKTSQNSIFKFTGAALTVLGIIFWAAVGVFDFSFGDESEVPSIAILPLDNKGSEEDEFYAYGISSDLVSDVTSAGLIRVASLKAIEELGDIPFQEKAKQLFVRYVAQGTIWKRDSIFQLSMELYDTQTEKIVWSERWQKDWKELPVIRDVLAENILDELKVDYTTDSPSYTVNPDAYEFYLKAKHKKRKNIEDTKVVRGLLNKAIKLDDNLIVAKLLLGSIADDMDKTMDIYTSALKQAEELGDKTIIALCLGKIGWFYTDQSVYEKALDYFKRAHTLFEELDDKDGVSKSFHALGSVYDYINEDDKALDYFEKAFAIFEELEHKLGIANTLVSIGIMHSQLGDNDRALSEMNKALVIIKELGKKSVEGHVLGNMGVEYERKGDYGKAFDYYNRSLQISEEIGNKFGTGNNNMRIGDVYIETGDYAKALDCYERARIIYKKIDYKSRLSSALRRIGLLYSIKGNNEKAMKYYKMSLTIGEEIDNKRVILWSFNDIGYQYYNQSNYKKSKEYLEKSMSLYKELDKDIGLTFLTYLSLIYKNNGQEYDEKEIHTLIKDADDIGYGLNYRLYELLEDKYYLENAYKKIQEKVDAMDVGLKEKFLSYPIPEIIVEEWEGIS